MVPCSRGNQLLPRKLCILKCTDAYYKGLYGADGETRTHTPKASEPKSDAAANYATSAKYGHTLRSVWKYVPL